MLRVWLAADAAHAIPSFASPKMAVALVADYCCDAVWFLPIFCCHSALQAVLTHVVLISFVKLSCEQLCLRQPL